MTPQEEREAVINDLADDVIRVAWMVDKRDSGRRINPPCEVCGRLRLFEWYRVYVENPSVVVDDSDAWHLWGRSCFDCMTMIVSAGGTPLPCRRAQT